MRDKIKRFMLPVLRARSLALMFLVAVVAVTVIGLAMWNPVAAAVCLAAVPFLGIVAPEEEFQQKVLGGVEALRGQQTEFKTAQEKLLSDVSRLDGVTKQALEDLTKAKGSVNDFAVKLAVLEKRLQLESKAAFGDPIARFCASEERKAWLMGCLRKALGLPLTEIQKTALTGIDSGLGQATIPTETDNAIYDVLLRYGQWNTLGQVPVGSTTRVLPLTTARPTAYFIAQGAQGTEGAVTGSSVSLLIKDIIAWLPVSNSLIEDSASDMTSYVLDLLGQAVAYRMDWACFAADGTDDSTDGAFTGIFVGGTAANAGAGNTAVENTDLEDWLRCLTTVAAAVLQRPARWWIHPQLLARAILVRDQNGRPIFQTALEAPAPGAIGSILGYPVTPTAAAPSTNAASAKVAVFGEPNGSAVGIRKQANFAQSSDFQFDYNRTAFRCVMRGGHIIRNATSFAVLTLPAV